MLGGVGCSKRGVDKEQLGVPDVTVLVLFLLQSGVAVPGAAQHPPHTHTLPGGNMSVEEVKSWNLIRIIRIIARTKGSENEQGSLFFLGVAAVEHQGVP